MTEPKSRDKPFDISKWVVWEAFQRVKANKGAAGVDEVSIAEFEQDRDKNLYRIWNRMSSVCAAVAYRADTATGWRPGRAGSRNSPGIGDLPVVGEPLHALRVRCVDGPGVPEHSIRAVLR